MKTGIILFLLVITSGFCYSQLNPQYDSTVNNLVHPIGYVSHEDGTPPVFTKAGKGKKTLILIPGLGFSANVFDDFIETNKKKYTMYVITLPGFGETRALPMPERGASYGDQTWHRSVCRGINRLIEREKIDRPVLVGHFITGTQIAMRMALDYPDKLEQVIILGGSAKMMARLQGKLVDQPLKEMIRGTDTYWGPQWFKHMIKKSYDDGNFSSDVYSARETTAKALWKQVATTPMPVAVRYSCEYFASDVIAEIESVKCSILVIRPMFTEKFWKNQMNSSWVQPQFIESWNVAQVKKPSIKIVDIPDSGVFVWKDRPDEVNKAIKEFVYSQ